MPTFWVVAEIVINNIRSLSYRDTTGYAVSEGVSNGSYVAHANTFASWLGTALNALAILP